ncbi:MAG: hypothetical protein LUD81_02500 [Clostridiales bacterium]|nr:hypothetical protein [Clostridiales bacterium]
MAKIALRAFEALFVQNARLNYYKYRRIKMKNLKKDIAKTTEAMYNNISG